MNCPYLLTPALLRATARVAPTVEIVASERVLCPLNPHQERRVTQTDAIVKCRGEKFFAPTKDNIGMFIT